MHILSLPAELTVALFHHLIPLDPPQALLSKQSLGWINVTFVCQTWRNLAIGCPTLWTDITGDTLGPWWLDAFVERSQKSTLTLRDSSDDRVCRKLCHIIPRTLHRIRFLSLERIPPDSLRTLLASRPAPNMVECHLRWRNTMNLSLLGDHVEFDDGTTELFAGNAPRLRVLSVWDIHPFPCTNPTILSGLVSLNLSYWDFNYVLVKEILDILRRIQRLENLIVHYRGPGKVWPRSERVPDTVELKHLKVLDINGGYFLFHDFHRHLRYPRTTRLAMKMCDRTRGRSDVEVMLTLFSMHPSRSPVEEYKTIALYPTSDFTSLESLRVECWEEELPLTTTILPIAPFTLTLHLPIIQSMVQLPPINIYELVTSTLRFPNARMLCLDSLSENVMILWAIDHLRNISTLSFTSSNGSDDLLFRISQTLFHLADIGPEATGANERLRDPLLPRLQTLAFAWERYGLMDCTMYYESTEAPITLLEVLRRFSLTRQSQGFPLQRIYIHSSTLRSGPTSDPVALPSELVKLIHITEDVSRMSMPEVGQ